MTVVLVGRLTPTDANPGETTAPWQAFQFDFREEAEEWDRKPWYPDAMILDIVIPDKKHYTAEEFLSLFYSGKYDHMLSRDFCRAFPLAPGELEKVVSG